jgi:hypothetical protein
VADRPLRPATDRSLGRPLPHQLANRTQAAPKAPSQAFCLSRCAVLAPVSQGCPPPQDTFLRVTHPSAAARCRTARLACVKHSASVRSEPGSNSQVHQTRTGQDPSRPNAYSTKLRSPLSILGPFPTKTTREPHHRRGATPRQPGPNGPSCFQKTDALVKERRPDRPRSPPSRATTPTWATPRHRRAKDRTNHQAGLCYIGLPQKTFKRSSRSPEAEPSRRR